MGQFRPKMMLCQLWSRSIEFLGIEYNERGEKVNENNFIGFSEKKFLYGKCNILGPKVMRHHNSRSAVKIFLKILQNEWGRKMYIKIILMLFLQKFSLGAVGSFLVQKWRVLDLF